jgi:hypothetical protein
MDQEAKNAFFEELEKEYVLVKRGAFWKFLGGVVGAAAVAGGVSWVAAKSAFQSEAAEIALSEIQRIREEAQKQANDIDRMRKSAAQREERMIVRVEGKANGKVNSLPVDHDRFRELCGDGDGCDVTLALEGLRGDTVPTLLPTYNGGPCKMFYDVETNGWSIETSCVTWRQELGVREDFSTYDNGAFKPYAPTNAYGFDGVDQFDGNYTILTYAYVCYFAESPPLKAEPGFVADKEPGLHLTYAGSDWTDFPTKRIRLDDNKRACLLVVDD